MSRLPITHVISLTTAASLQRTIRYTSTLLVLAPGKPKTEDISELLPCNVLHPLPLLTSPPLPLAWLA
jgi:hypothetical protein